MGVVSLSISRLHPAFAGHFPGAPIVPGVVLLDETLRALKAAAGDGAFGCDISATKFHSVVEPGEDLTLEHEAGPDGSIRFVIRAPERLIASGRLKFAGSARGARREA